MLRAMVFIDYQNFSCAINNYYKQEMRLPSGPRLDYNKLPQAVVGHIPGAQLIKTFLCAPKPDDFLMQDPLLANEYKWLTGLKNQRNFDVIEGEYVARKPEGAEEMYIGDKWTYYKEEKGTDVNIAVESLTKGFNNAYDIAVFMSADTDYLPIYRTLRTIGKLCVVAIVKGQYIGKLIPNIDNYIIMDKPFFDRILRPDTRLDMATLGVQGPW